MYKACVASECAVTWPGSLDAPGNHYGLKISSITGHPRSLVCARRLFTWRRAHLPSEASGEKRRAARIIFRESDVSMGQ